MDLLFIKSDAEYRETLQRLASLKGLDGDEAREALLTELVRACESRSPQKESEKLSEAIQSLTREGALDELGDE